MGNGGMVKGGEKGGGLWVEKGVWLWVGKRGKVMSEENGDGYHGWGKEGRVM